MPMRAERSDRSHPHKVEKSGATPEPATTIRHVVSGDCRHCQRFSVLEKGYCDNCSFMRVFPVR